MYSNIFVFITCNGTSIKGWSSTNSNMCVKLETSSSHSTVPHRNSTDMYQFLGIMCNVCTNWWTHSCHRHASHVTQHRLMWLTRLVSPVYLRPLYITFYPNWNSINLQHWVHSEIDCLCANHHLEGITFNVKSKADNHWGSITFSSNSVRKEYRLGSPS